MSFGISLIMKNPNSHPFNRYTHQPQSSVREGSDDPDFPPTQIRDDAPYWDEGQLTPPPSTQTRDRVGRNGLSQKDIANTVHMVGAFV